MRIQSGVSTHSGRSLVRSPFRRVVFITASCLVSSCATNSLVTSTELSGNAPAVVEGASAIYGVGRSSVEVTLSLEDAGGEDAAATDANGDAAQADSGGGDASKPSDRGDSPAKDGKKAAAAKPRSKAPTSPTADADKPGTDNRSAPSQPSSCKDLRSAYRSSRFAYMRFKADTDELLEGIDEFASSSRDADPVSDAQLKPLLTGLQRFIKDSPAALEMAHSANATYDLIEDECPSPIKVALKHVVDADPARLFELKLKTNDFASDELTMKTDEAGLPVLVETSADDQTGTFLTSLATSIGTVVGVAKPIGIPNAGQQIVVTGARISATPFDRLTLSALASALTKAAPSRRPAILDVIGRRILDMLPETPESIDPKIPNAPQTYLISDVERNPIQITEGIALQANCGLQLPGPSGVTSPTQSVASYSGIVASLPRPCTLRVRPVRVHFPEPVGSASGNAPSMPMLKIAGANYEVGPDLAHASIMALDSRSLIVVPVDRTSLVKRTAHIEFAAGRVVNTQYSRPSPAVAAASLPGNIIGGFLGGIVGGITGRTNSVKAESDLINAKANMLAAQAAYKKAVAEAKSDNTDH